MSNKTICMLAAVSMLAVPGFSAQERVLHFQNHVRVGYDDNIYKRDSDEHGSGYVTDVLNLSGKFNFSSRTDALLYWQPELRYRFDADPEVVSYQDLYARLNHAVSQRTFMTLSDRFRYQDQEGQNVDGLDEDDENYIENDLMGALDITVDELSLVKLGGGYEFRIWDDDNYGEDRGNNYDQFRANASYARQLKKEKTEGMLGLNYEGTEYDGSRGNLDTVTLMGGVDQNFTPNLTGFGRLGCTMSSVDNETGDSDDTTPYLDAGFEFIPTERTTLNGSIGYSVYRSDNSYYNAQDRFNLALGVRQDITSRISLAGKLSYVMSSYEGSYAYQNADSDAEDEFFRFGLRATYKLNRNNFLEAGYEFSDRSSDSDRLREYTRNVVDVGWRLRL